MPGDQLALEIRERDAALVTVLVTGWDLEKDDPRLSAFDFWLKTAPQKPESRKGCNRQYNRLPPVQDKRVILICR